MNAPVFDFRADAALFCVALEQYGIAILDVPSTPAGDKVKREVDSLLNDLHKESLCCMYDKEICSFVYFDTEKLNPDKASIQARNAYNA